MKLKDMFNTNVLIPHNETGRDARGQFKRCNQSILNVWATLGFDPKLLVIFKTVRLDC